MGFLKLNIKCVYVTIAKDVYTRSHLSAINFNMLANVLYQLIQSHCTLNIHTLTVISPISPLSEEFARSGPEVTRQRKAGKEAKLGKYSYAVLLQSLNK